MSKYSLCPSPRVKWIRHNSKVDDKKEIFGNTRLITLGVLVALVIEMACGGMLGSHHHVVKRQNSPMNFFDIGCKGIYEAAIFVKMQNVCLDCFNLFRDYNLHGACSGNCFTGHYFKGCLEALQKQDEIEEFKTYIQQLNGASSGFEDKYPEIINEILPIDDEATLKEKLKHTNSKLKAAKSKRNKLVNEKKQEQKRLIEDELKIKTLQDLMGNMDSELNATRLKIQELENGKVLVMIDPKKLSSLSVCDAIPLKCIEPIKNVVKMFQ